MGTDDQQQRRAWGGRNTTSSANLDIGDAFTGVLWLWHRVAGIYSNRDKKKQDALHAPVGLEPITADDTNRKGLGTTPATQGSSDLTETLAAKKNMCAQRERRVNASLTRARAHFVLCSILAQAVAVEHKIGRKNCGMPGNETRSARTIKCSRAVYRHLQRNALS